MKSWSLPNIIKTVFHTFLSVLQYVMCYSDLELIFVYNMTPESTFIFFHMDVQLSQFHILSAFTTAVRHVATYTWIVPWLCVLCQRRACLLCSRSSSLLLWASRSGLSFTFRTTTLGSLPFQICCRRWKPCFAFVGIIQLAFRCIIRICPLIMLSLLTFYRHSIAVYI